MVIRRRDPWRTGAMTDPKIQTVQTIYEAFGRGDVATILDQLADDVDWAAESFSGKAAPWHGIHKGKGEVPHFFQGIAESSEVTDFEILSIGSNDTDVFVTIRYGMTAKSTGNSATTELHHWWQFEDGKVVRYRGSEDTALVAEVFGL
jgi:ketosteroid isomerase-like protein